MKNWMQSLKKEVDNDKKLILVGGASSSGKSYNSQCLANYLSNDHRVLMISADNYYKGVAKISVEKTCLKDKFAKYQKDVDIISALLKKITLIYPLQDKLKGNQRKEFNLAISPYVSKEDKEEFIDEIAYQLENMNFDEPFAIDFSLLSNQIKDLLNKKMVALPQYSFHTSEIDAQTEVNGNDYDILIVEGLYALREELLSQLNGISYVTSAIVCDPNTLLSRKLHRDILEKRSKLSEEMILLSFLDIIMPAYDDYILPTLQNAKYILNTSITEKEVSNKVEDKQIKFQTNKEIYKLLKSIGAVKKNVCKQKDFYLENKTDKNPYNLSISLRESDGIVSNLQFKFLESIYSRQTENYSLKSFSIKNRQSDNLLNSFAHAGFNVSDIIDKTRTIYEIDGKTIKLDEIENLGLFLELDNENIYLLNKYKNQLNLNEPVEKSYRELSKSSKNNETDIENA